MAKLLLSFAAAAAQTAAIPLATQAPPQSRGTPTAAEWARPEAQAFVSKAKTIAGNDPDLRFDAAWNCSVSGTHVGGVGGLGPAGGGPGGDGAILQNSTPPIPFVPTSNPPVPLPPERIADNLWYFGTSAVGTLLVTSGDGYILFDTLNNADEARDILIGGMKKVGLDPAKIRYVVFGHFHLDHTGGAHYIQELVRPEMMLMGREDWPLYFAAVAADGKNGRSRLTDKIPMRRGVDVQDGQSLRVGDTTVTLLTMKGHTPGSVGFIFDAKYRGKSHPVLVVTASAGGDNVRDRDSFTNGYEHIWNAGLKAKIEAVIQSHPNYNQNTISRMDYVTRNYPPVANPILYGTRKAAKYIEITRACAQARLAALGW